MKRRHRVLGVDDNPTNLAILQEILEDEYDFDTASSGEEALEKIPEMRPDVVLLDIMMPGINGYDVCREIRKDPDLKHTKIIMVSAKAQVGERLEGYEVGADDYVIKPFDEEELEFKVRVFVKLKSVQEVDQLKTDILSLLSHETRTPLKSLMMPAQMLMTSETMTDDMRRRLGELMFRNATRLHGFFDRLLQLSALRAGQWKAKLTQTTLAQVVETALGELAEPAAKKGVVMDTDLVADTPITVARKEMTAVIASVLDNAIRFSPPGGCVKVRLETDGTNHVLSVTDHGKGIDASVLGRVFEEFADCEDLENSTVMIDSEIEDCLGRFGLSLAIARQLITRHGGKISVESETGSWTTFQVCLPACSQELEEALVAVGGKGQADA